MSNKSHTLYVGATSDLPQRVIDHKTQRDPGSFTARYRFTRLVFFEIVATMEAALRRERQIKAWSRPKKVALIQGLNPNWDDLSRRFVDMLEMH